MTEPSDSATPPAPDLAAWRDALGAAGQSEDELSWSRVDGAALRALYVAGDRRREAAGRPGTPPFTRGATRAGEWVAVERLGPEAMSTETLVARARAAAAGAVGELHLEGELAAQLVDETARAALIDASALPVVLYPSTDAVALAEAASGGGQRLRVVCTPFGALDSAAPTREELEAARVELVALVERGRRAGQPSRCVRVDVGPAHEAGLDAADEVAAALGAGLEILRWAESADLPLADLPRRMEFAFALDADIFLGVAKLRAARLAWSKVLRALGVDGQEQGMRIHARVARRMLSRLEAPTNTIRGTVAALAAVVGGAQSVAVPPADALDGGTDATRRTARNTHHVLRWEAHLGRVMDPGGGSYYLESLSERLARRAWAAFQEREQLGGLTRAILDGSLRDLALASAARRAEAMSRGDLSMVGVNRYARVLGRSVGTAEPPDAVKGAVWPAQRDAAGFEALRARVARLAETERRALVVGVGPAKTTRGRAKALGAELATAGLSVEPARLFESVTELADGLDDVDGLIVGLVIDPSISEPDALTAVERVSGARGIAVGGSVSEALRGAGRVVPVHGGADRLAAFAELLGLTGDGGRRPASAGESPSPTEERS